MTVGVAHRALNHDPFHNPPAHFCSEGIATIPLLVLVWTRFMRMEFGFTDSTGRFSNLHCELTPSEYTVGSFLLLILSWGLSLSISRAGFIHNTPIIVDIEVESWKLSDRIRFGPSFKLPSLAPLSFRLSGVILRNWS